MKDIHEYARGLLRKLTFAGKGITLTDAAWDVRIKDYAKVWQKLGPGDEVTLAEQPQDVQAKLLLALLVLDTKWIPMAWYELSADEHTWHEPSQVKLENLHPHVLTFAAELLSVLSSVLSNRKREIPDTYYRGAYEKYNTLMVYLMPRVSSTLRSRLVKFYTVDPRFPSASVTELLRSPELDSGLKRVVNARMQLAVLGPIEDYPNACDKMPWYSQEDRISRYRSCVSDLISDYGIPYGGVALADQMAWLKRHSELWFSHKQVLRPHST